MTLQRGVGLIEVMVALLLLGIAVVGFAALQVRAVGSTHDAYFRTQGMAIAQEVAERLRANSNATFAINAVATYRAGSTGGVSDTQCITNTCTPTQMAQFDIANLNTLAASTLPNGRFAVVPCTNATNSCVLVSWNLTSPTVGNTTTDCMSTGGSYILNADCMMLEIY
ncbi:type IV pilus modification protein PilV [Fluviicoccus keumensis]